MGFLSFVSHFRKLTKPEQGTLGISDQKHNCNNLDL